MKKITFRMTAYTAAAGKYSENAPNRGNEDNFFVDDDLADDSPQRFATDETVELSNCGVLMVVADGMGGTNAGEVASEIAIDTVKEYFAPGKVTPSMAATHDARKRYMEKVITEADKNIKKEARQNHDHEGMGSTIIMAWLAYGELTVSWCGDSRAYLYSPVSGLKQLSKDHSYVQELVDFHGLDPELAFDHPQSNIITRSLGDPGKEAKAQTLDEPYKVCKGDIIMLCSDGLSGVLRDREMEAIIDDKRLTMQACREALWLAAEAAGWYDNVTTILCEILGGAPEPVRENRDAAAKLSPGSAKGPSLSEKRFWEKSIHIRLGTRKGVFRATTVILVLFALLIAAWVIWKDVPWCGKKNNDVPTDPLINSQGVDTIPDKNAETHVIQEGEEKYVPGTQESQYKVQEQLKREDKSDDSVESKVDRDNTPPTDGVLTPANSDDSIILEHTVESGETVYGIVS